MTLVSSRKERLVITEARPLPATREALRHYLARKIHDGLQRNRQTVEGGRWDGVPVVTTKDIDEVLDLIFSEELPPPDGRSAEVKTDAIITVWAKCPDCRQYQSMGLGIYPVLTIEGPVRTLSLKAKASKVQHACGQMTAEPGPDAVGDGQIPAFELEDIVGDSPIEEVSEEAEPTVEEEIDEDVLPEG